MINQNKSYFSEIVTLYVHICIFQFVNDKFEFNNSFINMIDPLLQ